MMAEPFIDFRNAFVAACSTAALGGSLSNVTIVDGPVTARTSEFQKLFIGASPGGDSLVAEGNNDEGNLPGMVDIETFALICIAEARGDQLSILRSSVFVIKKAVRDILRAAGNQRTLGVENISSARMGAWSLEEMQGDRGPYVALTFRVEAILRPGIY